MVGGRNPGDVERGPSPVPENIGTTESAVAAFRDGETVR